MLDGRVYDRGEAFMRIIEHRREEERRASIVDLSYEPASTDAAGIVREICLYRGVTKKEMMGPYRARKYSRTRDEIAYWLRRRTGLSFRQIGERIGRDHTGAIYCVQNYSERYNLPMVWQGVNTRRKTWRVTMADVDARSSLWG